VNDIWERYKFPIVAIVVIAVALLSSLIVVPETQQAVIVRGGKPVDVINPYRADQAYGQTDAGLSMRIPLYDRVVRIDKQLLTVDMQPEQVLSTDQQRLNVNAFARIRVVDPIKMVESAGTTDRLIEQLQPILVSAVRQELGRRTFQALLTAERGEAMARIRDNLEKQADEYGAKIVDVRIKETDLPDGALQSAFTRMEAARKQQATTIRAEGKKQAQLIQADAQAQAARIYAEAFNQDPDFYDFWRAMQSYDTAFAKSEDGTTIMISPNNSYLKEFVGQ
jgi:modulator of FtsH protease HflC